MLILTNMTKGEPATKVPSWSDGNDTAIIQALERHYAGEIDITKYWSVGDERTITLSPMSTGGRVGETHVAQNATFVLMHQGGKELVTPIGDKTECAFIVGMKNVLANNTTIESGYMNNTDTNTNGWNSCKRRYWCNEVFYEAVSLKEIFKQFKNITSKGSPNFSTKVTSEDYFALPSEKEVWGATEYTDTTAEEDNFQFLYYKSSINRRKAVESDDSIIANYWLRSASKYDSTNFCFVNYSNSGGYYTPVRDYAEASINTIGLAPFGVI